jgi:hypothetical protein
MFFELGLPDTRGAKWVKVSPTPAFRGAEDLPLADQASYAGNAWLVSESPDGTCELIVKQTRRLRGRRTGSSGPSDLPSLQIQPADLEHDLQILARALTAKTVPGSDEDQEEDESASRRAEKTRRLGAGVLFLAHLQRQGRTDVVQKSLALLLRPEGPSATLDAAISLLADGRFVDCTAVWSKNGDSNAYAAALDALCAQFPRGWGSLKAVQRVATRAREHSQARQGVRQEATREAEAAAALLQGLTREDYQKLPRHRNWMLPVPADSTLESESDLGGDELAIEDAETSADETSNAAEEPTTEASATGKQLATFFAEPRRAAATLTQLLGDSRLLRLTRGERDSAYEYSSPYDTPEEALKRAYDKLPRPIELGELVAELLRPVMPDHLRSDLSSGRSAEAVAWVASIAPLSDEQLAWEYLSSAEDVQDATFPSALGYLVEHGSPETHSRLQEVFTDPAVWSGYSFDPVLPHLRAFLKQLRAAGHDTASFGKKVVSVARQALEMSRDSRDESGGDLASPEEDPKLKNLDQLVNPRSVGELLAELEALPAEKAAEQVQIIQSALLGIEPAEAERQVLRSAARMKSVGGKAAGLHALIRPVPQREQGGKPAKPHGPLPDDPETREALLALLEDRSLIDPAPWTAGQYETVAELAAASVTWPRLDDAEQARWAELPPSPHRSQLPGWKLRRAHWRKGKPRCDGRTAPPSPKSASANSPPSSPLSRRETSPQRSRRRRSTSSSRSAHTLPLSSPARITGGSAPDGDCISKRHRSVRVFSGGKNGAAA